MNQNYHILQELKTDFLNISQCWLYAVLYYHQIYPMHTFQFRTVFGVSTPVTASKKLKGYVDKLFKEMENNLMLVNYMEIELISDGYPVMGYRLSAGFIQSEYYNNRHQKQTELKYFINKMVQSMQGIQIKGQKKSFNFYVEYRYDKSQKIKTGQFIDKWIIQQQKSQMNQQIVGSSLKLADMSIIVSRFQTK